MENKHKIPVGVTAKHDAAGNIKPLAIHWPDGRDFDVDRLLDARPAASTKAGGYGMRYICRIMNKQVYLFYDDYEKRWYVEL
ncbi:hypothetical protein [Sporomusa aerivorans]|uniref:hypothetical protein n=1 Tax=Sporomusa aerivorans TaxID=204936 RepID=UPI00352AB200